MKIYYRLLQLLQNTSSQLKFCFAFTLIILSFSGFYPPQFSHKMSLAFFYSLKYIWVFFSKDSQEKEESRNVCFRSNEGGFANFPINLQAFVFE